MPMDQLSTAVIACIRASIPVFFSPEFPHAKKHGSKTSGLMDVHLYDLSPFNVDHTYGMTKSERLLSLDGRMAHCMVITAAHLDDQGKAVRYKVANSWGDHNGKKGWFVMTQEWFEEYVYEVMLPREMGTGRQLEVLDNKEGREVVQLDPWDVMA